MYATAPYKYVPCTAYKAKAALPISADGLTVSIAPLADWKFDIDNGWRCPKHIESKEYSE